MKMKMKELIATDSLSLALAQALEMLLGKAKMHGRAKRITAMAFLLSLIALSFSTACTSGVYLAREERYGNAEELRWAMNKGDLKLYEDNSSFYADIAGGRERELECFIFKKSNARKAEESDLKHFDIGNADDKQLNEIVAKCVCISEYSIGVRPGDARLWAQDKIKTYCIDASILMLNDNGKMTVLKVDKSNDDAPWIKRSWVECQATKPVYLASVCFDAVLLPSLAICYFFHMCHLAADSLI